MLQLMFVFLLFQQEHHYVDGIEFLLVDGTLIKTISAVTEDRQGYNWREEGIPISLSREKIRNVNYFSLVVPGPAPIAITPTVAERRSNPQGVFFTIAGKTHLRVLHQDQMGQSLEGRSQPIRAVDVYEVSRDSSLKMMIEFQKMEEGFTCELAFYSLTGQPLKTVFLDSIDQKAANKLLKKGKNYPLAFELPTNFDLKKIGLVELTIKPVN